MSKKNLELLKQILNTSVDKQMASDLVELTAKQLRAERRHELLNRLRGPAKVVARAAFVGVIVAGIMSMVVPELTFPENILVAPITGIAHLMAERVGSWLFV
jgi:hypothetical protein